MYQHRLESVREIGEPNRGEVEVLSGDLQVELSVQALSIANLKNDMASQFEVSSYVL